MTAFTLDLPDELAARLAELPKAEVNAYAASVLTPLVETDDDFELDADAIAAVEEGLKDMDAGNLRTLEQVDEAVEAALAARFGPSSSVGKAA